MLPHRVRVAFPLAMSFAASFNCPLPSPPDVGGFTSFLHRVRDCKWSRTNFKNQKVGKLNPPAVSRTETAHKKRATPCSEPSVTLMNVASEPSLGSELKLIGDCHTIWSLQIVSGFLTHLPMNRSRIMQLSRCRQQRRDTAHLDVSPTDFYGE